jgi:hypothetical protein
MQLFSQRPQAPSIIPDDVPVYRVKDGSFFADDQLFQAGSIIAYEEEPNVEMEPLNKLALEKMQIYLRKLDKLGREKAEKEGKGYTSLEDAFANAYSAAFSEGKKVSLLNGPRETPVMGNKVKRQPKVNKIADPAAATNPVRMTLASERDAVNGGSSDLSGSDLI